MLKVSDLFDLTHTLAGEYLAGFEHPWQALKGIQNLILTLGGGDIYNGVICRF